MHCSYQLKSIPKKSEAILDDEQLKNNQLKRLEEEKLQREQEREQKRLQREQEKNLLKEQKDLQNEPRNIDAFEGSEGIHKTENVDSWVRFEKFSTVKIVIALWWVGNFILVITALMIMLILIIPSNIEFLGSTGKVLSGIGIIGELIVFTIIFFVWRLICEHIILHFKIYEKLNEISKKI
jgi:hypothetical protein